MDLIQHVWNQILSLIERELDAVNNRDLDLLKKLGERKKFLITALSGNPARNDVLWALIGSTGDRLRDLAERDRDLSLYSSLVQELVELGKEAGKITKDATQSVSTPVTTQHARQPAKRSISSAAEKSTLASIPVGVGGLQVLDASEAPARPRRGRPPKAQVAERAHAVPTFSFSDPVRSGFTSKDHVKVIWVSLLNENPTMDLDQLCERTGFTRGGLKPILTGALRRLEEVMSLCNQGQLLTEEAQTIVTMVQDRWGTKDLAEIIRELTETSEVIST